MADLKDEKLEKFMEDVDENKMLILVKIDKSTGNTGIYFPDDIGTNVIEAVGHALVKVAHKVEKEKQDKPEEKEDECWN